VNVSEARKQITHLDDLEIISREPALIAHPHPGQGGRLVPTAGVEHVLLEDGTETNICSECGYSNSNGRAVVAHMSGAHADRAPSYYSDEELRTLVREVQRAKQQGVRNYAEVAAQRLSQTTMRPAQGEAWTAQIVSNLYNTHKDRVGPVRVRKTREDVVREVQAASARAGSTDHPATERAPVRNGARPAEKISSSVPHQDQLENESDPGYPLHETPDVDTAELRGPDRARHNNRVRRIQRMLRETAQELEWFARQYDETARKAAAYDKLKQTIAGL
jgi:hypothetical protein